ncbi:head GIN domain-containing protein [Neolewinella antarctica]|uniref:Putative auto-transporter adhesin head GIN domain-containing protein n=1 Tax=Neolewinella antarctica TaxID=442734 RepID=A0ABX0XDK2_9BACT|nr:head GIN domain-containing protein [Neolewinella antarctica]NJC27292.1 hypothetical protein [Neolewinella antarctica]
MKLIFTLFLLAFLSTTTLQAQNWGWNNKSVRGNGDVVTQTRSLKDFDGVKACCSFNVEITPGANFSVEVEAESNLQEYIETEVSGSTLEIGFRNRVSINNKQKITVFVTMPVLEKIDASSSADIVTIGAFEGDRLRLESSSASSIKVTYTGNRVDVDASSSGKITVSGKAGTIDAEASSGSNVHAEGLEVKEASADVSSGAGIRINASERLDAEASSGGRIRYQGNPSSVNADASSGGTVKKG